MGWLVLIGIVLLLGWLTSLVGAKGREKEVRQKFWDRMESAAKTESQHEEIRKIRQTMESREMKGGSDDACEDLRKPDKKESLDNTLSIDAMDNLVQARVQAEFVRFLTLNKPKDSDVPNVIMCIETGIKSYTSIDKKPVCVEMFTPKPPNGNALLVFDHWFSMPMAPEHGKGWVICESSRSVVPATYLPPTNQLVLDKDTAREMMKYLENPMRLLFEHIAPKNQI